MHKEFERFMKSRRAWSKWVRNTEEIGNISHRHLLKMLASKPDYLIDGSFLWKDTQAKEGLDFWYNLDKDWQNHLQQLKSKGGQNA